MSYTERIRSFKNNTDYIHADEVIDYFHFGINDSAIFDSKIDAKIIEIIDQFDRIDIEPEEAVKVLSAEKNENLSSVPGFDDLVKNYLKVSNLDYCNTVKNLQNLSPKELIQIPGMIDVVKNYKTGLTAEYISENYDMSFNEAYDYAMDVREIIDKDDAENEIELDAISQVLDGGSKKI